MPQFQTCECTFRLGVDLIRSKHISVINPALFSSTIEVILENLELVVEYVANQASPSAPSPTSPFETWKSRTLTKYLKVS